MPSGGPWVPYRYFDDRTGKPLQPSPDQETGQHLRTIHLQTTRAIS